MTNLTRAAGPSTSKVNNANQVGWWTQLAAAPLWEKGSLALVLLLSAVLNLYQLTNNGLGNLYYAATVKSMLTSWHNFFFVSFDPGGFVTADKPPLGLWIQTASAKLLGFSSVSLLLPEALAGILSVALLYALVRRAFGAPAGLLAALALAVTPVSVVASRDNILDSLLVFFLLLATWAALQAADKADWRWLVLSAVLVGAAFNIKTLEAYLIVPALGLLYLLSAPVRWRTRLAHLAIAGVIMVVVSLSWSVAVDLTPASQRPYVGSSKTNSEINLALGYNGLERITGLFSGSSSSSSSSTSDQLAAGGFSATENGPQGIQRLFNPTLGNQASWLLPLALIGLLSSIWQIWPVLQRKSTRNPQTIRTIGQGLANIRLSPPQQHAVVWGTWLVVVGAFFSIASFFHSYYLNLFAPAVCALAAVGLVGLWQDYQRDGWQGWLLPVALLATAAEQWHILAGYKTWDNGLSAMVIVVTVLAAALLVLFRWGRQPKAPSALQGLAKQSEVIWLRFDAQSFSLANLVVIVGMVILLVTPTVWSYRSQGNGGLVPAAGPDNGMTTGPTASVAGVDLGDISLGGAMRSQDSADPKLVSYLQSHRGKAKYLAATTNSTSAEPLILSTGQPVMALGGFLGSDKILTLSQFQQAIQSGTVRYFLSDGIGMPGDLTTAELEDLPPELQEIIAKMGGAESGGAGATALDANSEISSWVSANCTTVPQSEWSSSTTSSTTGSITTGTPSTQATSTPSTKATSTPPAGGSIPKGFTPPAGTPPAGAFPGGTPPAGGFPGGTPPAGGFPGGTPPAGGFPGGAPPAGTPSAGTPTPTPTATGSSTGSGTSGGTGTGTFGGLGIGNQTLYDCATLKTAQK